MASTHLSAWRIELEKSPGEIWGKGVGKYRSGMNSMLHHTDYSTDHMVILAQIETWARGSVLRQQYLYH